MSGEKRVCLGVFTGAQGVHGHAKTRSFTEDPTAIARYGPVTSEDRRRVFTLTLIRMLKPTVALVTAPEIKSREDAQALSGTKLFVPRHRLDLPDEDEFYFEDLIGLRAFGDDGTGLGLVAAVHNFGAGDILELRHIPGHKGSHMVPFTREAVPALSLKTQSLTIAPAYRPVPPGSR